MPHLQKKKKKKKGWRTPQDRLRRNESQLIDDMQVWWLHLPSDSSNQTSRGVRWQCGIQTGSAELVPCSRCSPAGRTHPYRRACSRHPRPPHPPSRFHHHRPLHLHRWPTEHRVYMPHVQWSGSTPELLRLLPVLGLAVEKHYHLEQKYRFLCAWRSFKTFWMI